MSSPLSKAELRQLVLRRAQGCCEYCYSQAAFSPSSFAVEHITPQSRGGQTTLDNLAFACGGCNNAKYNHTESLDPITERIVPLYHSRQHKWEDHFSWREDGLDMIGISPTGRATIALLKLNRDNVVNLRQILILVGKHPPAPIND